MTIYIKLNNNKDLFYKSFDTIPYKYTDEIIMIQCRNLNLTSIPYYPNLEILDCCYNSIKSFHNYPKLTELHCSHNRIAKLPKLLNLKKLICDFNPNINLRLNRHENLKFLDCSFNNLSSIPIYHKLTNLICANNNITFLNGYFDLVFLDCSNNNLSYIEGFENLRYLNCSNNNLEELNEYPKLEVLICSYNRLKELKAYPLIQLHCTNNLLTKLDNLEAYKNLNILSINRNQFTELPDITTLPNLILFMFDDNPVIHIPEEIMAVINILEAFNNPDDKKEIINIADDSQNVHNNSLQKSINASITLILKDKLDITFDEMKFEIMTSIKLSKQVKDLIELFCSNGEMHLLFNISYKDLLLSIWNIIRKHENKDNILEIFESEILESNDKCFTGRFGRLINVLNGFDDRIQIVIDEKTHIGNIISNIQIKLEKEENYSVEKHKELSKIKLIEDGINLEMIETWISYIQ
jgi:Leucine-rich repeat (LRR) protein